MRLLPSALVLASATLIASPAFADSITHKRAKITIEVPDDWKSSTNGDQIDLSDADGDVAITFLVVDSGSTHKATKAARKELAKRVKKLSFDKEEEVEVNGMNGIAVKGDGFLGDINVDILLVVLDTPADDRDLLAIAIGNDANLDKHKQEVEWVFSHLHPKR
jgi:hypothetical protein